MLKRMKKLVSLLLAAALLLSACGSPASSGDADAGESSSGQRAAAAKSGKETVRLIIPGLSEETTVDPVSGLETKSLGEFQAFLNEQIPDYNIEIVTIAWDGWIQSMEAMLTAGDADVGIFTNQEVVPDWYMDLTPYLEKDEAVNLENLSEWFIEPAVSYMNYKSFNHPDDSGKIFGLPMTIACNIITYDSQIFKDWGVEEPNSGMTFTELADLAEKVTGTNPVTGKKNYGAYLYSSWTEWYALSYSAVKPYFSDTMDINDLDMEAYVESIKSSPEVNQYFTDLIRLVNCCNEAVATGDGDENWLSDANDVAINFDCNNQTKPFMQYVYAGDTAITDRYKPLMIPAGSYGEGFPEFYRLAIAQKAKNPDAAWEVIKTMVTDKDIVDFYLTNYQTDKITCLNDTSGMSLMEYPLNQERHAYQLENMFITDDYWHWRTAMQTVINQVLSKQYTTEQAVDAYYSEVKTWVENIKKQSGN